MARLKRWLDGGGGWLLVAFLVLLLGITLLLGGCAIGRTASGGSVVGVPIPGAPENLQEAAQAGANVARSFLPPPWGEIVGWGLATVGAAFGVKKTVDVAKAKTETAKLEGANEGWVAREQAAAIQAPMVTTAPVVVAPGGVA